MTKPKKLSTWVRCKLCTGTGVLRIGGECPDCDGNGEIERDSPTGKLQQQTKYKPSNRRALPPQEHE